MISIIAAIGKGGVIGKENKLLWHIPDDLKRFRELTSGHPVIMGRKTWESLPEKFRPLPERTNIVVTRNNDYKADRAITVKSFEDARAEAARAFGSDEIFVIGGGEIYKEALAFADRLYLTIVEDETDGDTFFPSYENVFNKKTHEEKRNRNGLKYSWVTLEK